MNQSSNGSRMRVGAEGSSCDARNWLINTLYSINNESITIPPNFTLFRVNVHGKKTAVRTPGSCRYSPRLFPFELRHSKSPSPQPIATKPIAQLGYPLPRSAVCLNHLQSFQCRSDPSRHLCLHLYSARCCSARVPIKLILAQSPNSVRT